MSHRWHKLDLMKNQLVLIASESTTRPARTNSGTSASGPHNPTRNARARKLGTGSRAEREARARNGATAARDALRVAIQRTTEREQSRRLAREAALLAAVTQPHLPHIDTRPGRSAA